MRHELHNLEQCSVVPCYEGLCDGLSSLDVNN